jgi:hypothetical protein
LLANAAGGSELIGGGTELPGELEVFLGTGPISGGVARAGFLQIGQDQPLSGLLEQEVCVGVIQTLEHPSGLVVLA